MLWIIRLSIVLVFLIIFVMRGTRPWAIGLLTVSTMVILDALRSRGLLIDLDFLGWVIGGVLAAGAFVFLTDLLRPTAVQSSFAPSRSRSASKDSSGFDRKLLNDQIRNNLSADDVLDLIFDLEFNENDIVNPAMAMPEVIVRVLDAAEAQSKLAQVAMSVERILTPIPKDNLPRVERLSAETPPALLRQYLLHNYSLREVNDLAGRVGLHPEELGSDARKSRVRRLLWHTQRRNRTNDLISAIKTPVSA